MDDGPPPGDNAYPPCMLFMLLALRGRKAFEELVKGIDEELPNAEED